MNDTERSATARRQELFFAGLEKTASTTHEEFLARVCVDDSARRRWLDKKAHRQTSRRDCALIAHRCLPTWIGNSRGKAHFPKSRGGALSP